MTRLSILCLAVCFAGGSLAAQTSTPPFVQATGSATINVQPDQGQLSVTASAQGSTAQDAGQQSATLSNTVIAALKAVIGSGGTVQTIAYSVSPRYTSGTATQAPTIAGYIASNSLLVTFTDLTISGRLIDAANQAGASNVGGLSFGLQDPDPVLLQALTKASKQAVAHATAIAAGLGAKVGAVISAQEGSTYTPSAITGISAGAASTTPIITGTVSVTATVTVTAQLQ